MEEADQLCDRIAIIDHGRIVALDTPAALKSKLNGHKVVKPVEIVPVTLEDVFISITGHVLRE
jgi:ABC-2 type transport system ATP-binding protein